MIVGVVVFHGNTTLSFSVLNSMAILCEQGHEVHLFQNRRQHWEGACDAGVHPAVRMHYFDTQTQIYEYSVRNMLDILRLSRFISRTVPRYDVIIGVDQDGIIAALIAKLFRKGQKLVYLSLEIILKADYAHKGICFLIKHLLERMALRLSDQLWIQDRFRGQALIEDLGDSDYPLTILPHSPRGIRTSNAASTYLRDKYHISNSTNIITYTGGIHPVYHSVQIAEMAALSKKWPGDAVLVMHGFGNESHLQYLSTLQNQRFFLSAALVSFTELDELIASADIGLALFNPEIDTNHRLMTSGKIMNYLKAGIPVIATGTPTTRDVIDRHQAGVCITKCTELPDAYHTVLADYERYAANAAEAFASEYEFDKNFQCAWAQLTSQS